MRLSDFQKPQTRSTVADAICNSNAQKIRRGSVDWSKIRIRTCGLAAGANNPFHEAAHAVLDQAIDDGEFDDELDEETFELDSEKPVVRKKSLRRSVGRDCAPGKICVMGGRIVS
jgi:hypothetical protein